MQLSDNFNEWDTRSLTHIHVDGRRRQTIFKTGGSYFFGIKASLIFFNRGSHNDGYTNTQARH